MEKNGQYSETINLCAVEVWLLVIQCTRTHTQTRARSTQVAQLG